MYYNIDVECAYFNEVVIMSNAENQCFVDLVNCDQWMRFLNELSEPGKGLCGFIAACFKVHRDCE